VGPSPWGSLFVLSQQLTVVALSFYYRESYPDPYPIEKSMQNLIMVVLEFRKALNTPYG